MLALAVMVAIITTSGSMPALMDAACISMPMAVMMIDGGHGQRYFVAGPSSSLPLAGELAPAICKFSTGGIGEMKCLRVYADENGESHFSEMEIAMSESQPLPGRAMSTPPPRRRTSSF